MKVEVKHFLKDVLFPYGVYTMFFLGIGLISGSIVHIPMDALRYSIILAIGVIIFIVASFLNETKIDKKTLTKRDIVRILFFSFTLSVSIGMVSGGIQHFNEVGSYAAKLIPIGIVVSLISFVIKNQIYIKHPKRIALLLSSILLLVAPLSYGLHFAVKQMPASSGHAHGDHHTPTKVDHHQKEKNIIRPHTDNHIKSKDTIKKDNVHVHEDGTVEEH